jgi:hypothetical protein
MGRWLVVLGLGVALMAPGVAKADAIDVQLVQLRAVAAQWWAGYGLTYTHCGEVTISYGQLPEGEWGETPDAQTDPAAWQPACRITISDQLTPTTKRIWISGRWLSAGAILCRTVLHEWGHLLLGPQHSSDPRNIMYEQPQGPPGACVTWAARSDGAELKRRGERKAGVGRHRPTRHETQHVMAGAGESEVRGLTMALAIRARRSERHR